MLNFLEREEILKTVRSFKLTKRSLLSKYIDIFPFYINSYSRFFDYLTECQVKLFKKEEEPSRCAITEEEKSLQKKIIFGGSSNNMITNKPKGASKGILKKKNQEPEPKPQKEAQTKVEIVPQDLTVDIFAKLLNNNLDDAEKGKYNVFRFF